MQTAQFLRDFSKAAKDDIFQGITVNRFEWQPQDLILVAKPQFEKSYPNHPGRKGGGSLPRGSAPSNNEHEFNDTEREAGIKRLAMIRDAEQGYRHFDNNEPQVALVDLGFAKGNRIFASLPSNESPKWKIENIPLHGAGKGQSSVIRASVERKLMGERIALGNDKSLPMVVRSDGVNYFQTGHHRVAAAVLAGRTAVRARVVEFTKDEKYRYPVDAITQKSMPDVHLGLSRQLQSLIGRYLDGEMSKSVFRDTFKRRLTDYYERAWREGAKKHGAEWQRGDRIKIDALVQKQFPFLDGFLQDMSNGRVSELQAIARTELYAKSAEAAYHHGRLARLGGKKLKWEMNPAAENCPDCIALNRKIRPATYWLGKGLVPKSGQTRCLGNCQCALSVTR